MSSGETSGPGPGCPAGRDGSGPEERCRPEGEAGAAPGPYGAPGRARVHGPRSSDRRAGHRAGLELPAAGATLQDRWAAIAPDLAGHVAAVGFAPESGQLTGCPESTAWATKARLEQARFI